MASQICRMYGCDRIATFSNDPDPPLVDWFCDEHKPPPDDIIGPDPYFGACPDCGKPLTGMNIWKNNYVVCREDHTFHLVGYNLFSGGMFETALQQEESRHFLSRSREVEPVFTGWMLDD